MKNKTKEIKLGLLSLLIVSLVSCSKIDTQQQNNFEVLSNLAAWKLKLFDKGTSNWQKNWFKDGLISTVKQSENGMNLIAGSANRDDAHHTVLWTKASFEGDIKIEYNYTRTDTQIINVNILYIQAQGLGIANFDKDISQWNSFREVPTMSTYYNYMTPLHISYAAFPMVNDDPENDYLRVRKYPITNDKTFHQTEVEPTYFNTGLFLPNVTYKVTVIKTKSILHLNVEGGGENKLYSWPLSKDQSPQEGRVGLRHMYTRSAQYSDFSVYTK
jgi:hypothetical protein